MTNTFYRFLIQSQSLKDRLAHRAVFITGHIFDGADQRRLDPYSSGFFLAGREGRCRFWHLPYDTETFSADAECDMTAGDKPFIEILSKDKACHVIFFRDISAYHKIFVFQILALIQSFVRLSK